LIENPTYKTTLTTCLKEGKERVIMKVPKEKVKT